MTERGRYVYEWPRPMVTVDAVVFRFCGRRIKILLIKRANVPFKDKWALPGGFIGIDEELEAAAQRELGEETGLVGLNLEQMRTYGTVGRDPRGRQITIVFFGIASTAQRKIKAGDDASKACWFDIEKLPNDIAFDHDEIIRFGIKKLKRKKAYRVSKYNKKY